MRTSVAWRCKGRGHRGHLSRPLQLKTALIHPGAVLKHTVQPADSLTAYYATRAMQSAPLSHTLCCTDSTPDLVPRRVSSARPFHDEIGVSDLGNVQGTCNGADHGHRSCLSCYGSGCAATIGTTWRSQTCRRGSDIHATPMVKSVRYKRGSQVTADFPKSHRVHTHDQHSFIAVANLPILRKGCVSQLSSCPSSMRPRHC